MLDRVAEKEILISQRLDINTLLHGEADFRWQKMAVVVYGPARMCNDLTAVISRLGKGRAGCVSFKLKVEAFSWWKCLVRYLLLLI